MLTFAKWPGVFLAVSLALSLLFFSQLPQSMATHWNIQGQVDDTSPKIIGAFIAPFIMLLMITVLMFFISTDPKRKNFQLFPGELSIFLTGLFAFLTYLHIITLIWNVGATFNIIRALMPAFALLFYLISKVLTKTKPNWVLGIRTPWTLSDDKVWEETHRFGARVFGLISIISLIGFLYPAIAFMLFISSVMIASAVTFIYSYYRYRLRHA